MWVPPLSTSIAVLFGCVAACFASELYASLCALVGQSYVSWIPAPQPRLGSLDLPLAVLVVLSLYSVATVQLVDSKAPVSFHAPFLSRPQTEEWKGWMQVVLLVYHYFGVDSLYKPARLIVASYVWLTAYGNTVYFLQAGDVSVHRLLAVATRLCVLPVTLSLCLQQPLMLYYVVPQSLLTLFLTAIFAKINGLLHSLCRQPSPNVWVQCCSVAALALLCFGLWDCGLLQTILSRIHDPVVSLPGLNGLVPFKSGHEWLFRTSLDHFMPVWGCATAVIMSSSRDQIDRIPRSLLLVVVPIAVAAVAGWFVFVYPLPKLEFNALHPFVGFVPITVFVIVRNCTSTLRSYYVPVLAWVGRHTLETYLFQHHLFLTSNAKLMLQFLPSSLPVSNFVMATCVFLAACSVVRIASDAVSKHLLSVMVGLHWKSTVGIAGTIALAYYGVYANWPMKRIGITLMVITVSLKLSDLVSFRSHRSIIVAAVGCWLFVASLLVTQVPFPTQLATTVLARQQVPPIQCVSLLSRDVTWQPSQSEVVGIPSRLAAVSCQSCLQRKDTAFSGVKSLFIGDSQARNLFRHTLEGVAQHAHGPTCVCTLDDVILPCGNLPRESYFGHRNFTVKVSTTDHQTEVRFVWAPHMSNVSRVLSQAESLDVIVTSFGSWDVLHAVNVTDADWQGWHHVSKSLVGTHTTLVVVTQPRVVPHRLPSPEKRARMHWAIMEAVNENVTKFGADAGIVDLFQMTSTPERALHSYDGVHYTDVEYSAAYKYLTSLVACGRHVAAELTPPAIPSKPSMIPVSFERGLMTVPTAIFVCLCMAAWRRFHP